MYLMFLPTKLNHIKHILSINYLTKASANALLKNHKLFFFNHSLATLKRVVFSFSFIFSKIQQLNLLPIPKNNPLVKEKNNSYIMYHLPFN